MKCHCSECLGCCESSTGKLSRDKKRLLSTKIMKFHHENETSDLIQENSTSIFHANELKLQTAKTTDFRFLNNEY